MGRIMVWWCPSGSPSVHPSVRPVSVRPFSALFSYMLWHIELKFCTWLCFSVLQIKFECRHFASIFEGVMPLCELVTLRQYLKELCLFVNLEYRKYTVFRTFLLHALTYSPEILHMTLFWCTMYYRSSFSVVILRQFLKELCLLLNLEYRKYTVFRTFLLHALTYSPEILHMTLF